MEHKSGNLAEAKRLFAKACDGGDMGGCNDLGLLEKQSGNLAIAKRLYVRACVGSDMRACTNLGALEEQAGNLAQARRLFAQACKGGEALACNALKAIEGKAQAREQQLRQAENEEEADERVAKRLNAHLGLVLSLVKASRGTGLGYGLGFRFGYRPLPSGEIGVLVAAWGEAGSLTVDAIPILFQFNAIAPLTPILSFFGGGQIGLLHYRLNTSGMYSDRGIVGLNAFACGLQAGGDVRLTSYLSLRLELAWLYANKASTTFSDSFSTDTYSWEANNIFHASAAFCLTF